MFEISEEVKKILYKEGYRIVGKNQHSAVKICHWTKESLRKGRNCFKRWYGVQSHKCLQCTVWLACINRCLYCWRSIRHSGPIPNEKDVDEPLELLEELIKQQRLLLSGFKGNPNVDKSRWEEAQNPNNVALSLIGESIIYPKISELLEEFHKRGFTSFLVTKGTLPKQLTSLKEEPTNLYISISAPDKETYEIIDKPLTENSWEAQMESLELMKSFNCNKVIRITLVKGLNMKNPEKYAKLIEKAEPDFCEVKSYTWVGESRKRLPKTAMCSMEDIEKFSIELSKNLGYKIKDKDIPSRVILLSKK
ncbi:MAG: 4-demethylwyosine synthase TYW1 [Nitrososphaerota archaeon]